jgi:hypothetical protein
MGLKYRNGNVYYYENRRVRGRIVSEYVGSGVMALIAHRYAQERKEEREAKRRATERRRAEFINLDAEIDSLIDSINTLSRGELIASGFYQHNRQWRLRDSGKHRNQTKGK